MRNQQETGLNFTLLATPAEGLSGRFVKIDRKKLRRDSRRDRPGLLHQQLPHPGLLPHLRRRRRFSLEAPYHALTNAGHISYVELDGDTTQNLEAFEKIVRLMKECRHRLRLHQPSRGPRSRLRLQRQSSATPAPTAAADEDDVRFERIRRITGYLVGTLDRFNNAKRAEEHDRVKHGLSN